MSWKSSRGEEMKVLLDTEFLIAIIEQYPVLWDKENELYKCSISTANAWKDVCRAVFLYYDSAEEHEKTSSLRLVMKRWKNVRDAWAKAQKRLSSDNQTLHGRYPRKYVFEDQLAFLKKVIKIKGNESSVADNTESDAGSDVDPDSDSIVTDNVPETAERANLETSAAPCNSTSSGNTEMTRPRPTRKRKLNLYDYGKYEDRPIRLPPPKLEKNGRHMLFFRSLIPSLNQLNEEQILEFQVGVLKLMQDVRKISSESLSAENWKIEDCSP